MIRTKPLPRTRATPRTRVCVGCNERISSSVCPTCKTRKATKRTSIGRYCDMKAALLCKTLAGFVCQFCERPGIPNAKGVPIIGLDWSHRVKRKHRGDAVRWSMDNCDALCRPCHDHLGTHQSVYIAWVNDRAGRDLWGELERRADLPWDKQFPLAALTAALKAAKEAA